MNLDLNITPFENNLGFPINYNIKSLFKEAWFLNTLIKFLFAKDLRVKKSKNL